jgi:two-component system chemotaxis response regulator CheY
MKILVVDDSAVMRKLISRALSSVEGPDLEVVEAADGMHALAMIAHHGTSIDLILCDMNMPSVDGLSLLNSLRSSPELGHIPFVIVTAEESGESTARALREGAAGVIGKPFQPEDIAALVRKKRSHGRRATSGAFKADAITRMVQAMSRSGGVSALDARAARND